MHSFQYIKLKQISIVKSSELTKQISHTIYADTSLCIFCMGNGASPFMRVDIEPRGEWKRFLRRRSRRQEKRSRKCSKDHRFPRGFYNVRMANVRQIINGFEVDSSIADETFRWKNNQKYVLVYRAWFNFNFFSMQIVSLTIILTLVHCK